jgi:hypothetical protein
VAAAVVLPDLADDADDADASGLHDPTLVVTPCGRSTNKNAARATATTRQILRNNRADSRVVQENLEHFALGAGPRTRATRQLQNLGLRRISCQTGTHRSKTPAQVLVPQVPRHRVADAVGGNADSVLGVVPCPAGSHDSADSPANNATDAPLVGTPHCNNVLADDLAETIARSPSRDRVAVESDGGGLDCPGIRMDTEVGPREDCSRRSSPAGE